MIIWGMSGKGHDASVTVFETDEVGGRCNPVVCHYTQKPRHNKKELSDLLKYGTPEHIVWYENPWKKAFRMWWAGQEKPFKRNQIKKYLKEVLPIPLPTYSYVGHHEAHAAHFYESPFETAAIIVADSIGEWDTTSIWYGRQRYKNVKVRRVRYPDSLGLFYSALTQAAGLTPNKDEGKLEKMYNEDNLNEQCLRAIENLVIPCNEGWRPMFWSNMHRGIGDKLSLFKQEDIATCTQFVFSKIMCKMAKHWSEELETKNIVLSGGCAFNKRVKADIEEMGLNVWSPANPGDGGSSRSCVLAYLRKQARFNVFFNQLWLNAK